MIELMDLVLLGCLCAVFSATCSVGFGIVVHILRNRAADSALQSMATSIESLRNTVHGATGRNARADKSERMSSAIAEGMLMLKEGKKPEEIIKAIAGSYPDIAVDLAKKHIGL